MTSHPLHATGLVRIVEEIVEAAGLGEDFRTDEHFHVRLPNPPWMDLVIESWSAPGDGRGPLVRRISVAHYYEQNGDLVPDPEVELLATGQPVELSQALLFTPLTRVVDGVEVTRKAETIDAVRFLEMWARNIRRQGFFEAARRRKTDSPKQGGPCSR